MQVVETNLKNLLFDYDCVTIPGLGGFIMQARTARLNRNRNQISPPLRSLSFNILLNHDDGLLLSTISKNENITYAEAGSMVNSYVTACKKRLAQGEKIKLDGIGEFLPTHANVILFQPDAEANFLAGSYGMSTINLYPVSRQEAAPRAVKKPADRKPRPALTRKTASVKWTLGLTLPVIILLLYGIIFPRSMQDMYTNYSGLLIDVFAESPGTRAPEQNILIKTPTLVEEKEELPVILQEEPPVEIIEETAILPAESVPLSQSSGKYYIIGGCFENELNAGRFMQELHAKGFDAEEAGTNKRGHVRISYKSFPDKGAALTYLEKIRQEENASAWLLKY